MCPLTRELGVKPLGPLQILAEFEDAIHSTARLTNLGGIHG